MNYVFIFLAFTIGLFIGHKWALFGVMHDLSVLDEGFQKLKKQYYDALESAILAERSYKQTIKEYEKMKDDLKKLL